MCTMGFTAWLLEPELRLATKFCCDLTLESDDAVSLVSALH